MENFISSGMKYHWLIGNKSILSLFLLSGNWEIKSKLGFYMMFNSKGHIGTRALSLVGIEPTQR